MVFRTRRMVVLRNWSGRMGVGGLDWRIEGLVDLGHWLGKRNSIMVS